MMAPLLTSAQSSGTASSNGVYLDIIVEPQTHVPVFYQGRPLPSVGSIVNLKALVFGTNIPSSNLIYTWKINDMTFGGSGIGQNAISFSTPFGTQMQISVSLVDTTNFVIAESDLTIPIVKPALRFYEINTLYGVNQKPLKEFNLISNSATILAEPYYIDSRVYNNPDVSYWDVDGTETQSSGNPYEMTFERTSYGGSARLGFLVRSTVSLLQIAKDEITVNY
jgi:hypothetical protein